MAKNQQSNLRKYRFRIDAYSPETMPLGRLAEYLTELSVLFGEDKSVHLIGIEEGSTIAALLVEREAEPKILAQLDAVERKEAPPEVLRAAMKIDEKLRQDNAKGEILSPAGDNLIIFPGRERVEPLTYGPFAQLEVVVGIPISVGGENDPVPVHLEGMDGTHNCWARRSVAKEIAKHLFTNVIRAEGTCRWARRPTGQWERVKFTIKDFKPLADVSLRDTIQKLRAIPADWKQKEDPLSELVDIRHGTDG